MVFSIKDGMGMAGKKRIKICLINSTKLITFFFKVIFQKIVQKNFVNFLPSEILYNAVDTNFFYPKKNKVLSSELKILVTGKYQEHLFYSLVFIINILNELNKNKILATVNFAGYYDPKVIKKLTLMATKYNIQDKIKFLGTYSQDKADTIYDSADVYFYFVHQSNCPNSVIKQYLVLALKLLQMLEYLKLLVMEES